MTAVASVKYTSPVQWRPYAVLTAGIFVGSIGIVFIRNAQLLSIPTVVIAVLRFSMAVLILTPFVYQRYRHQLRALRGRDLVFSALAGVMFALGLITGFESLNHTTVLISGVFGASTPLWTALIERFVQHVPLRRNVWMGLLMAIGGSVLISLSASSPALGSNALSGILLAVSSAILTGFYFLVGRSVRPRISLMPYIWLMCIFAALTSFIVLTSTGTPLSGYQPEGYFWILLITLGPQLVVQSSFNYALAYFPATVVGLLTQLITVGNAIVALIVYSQVPTEVQIIGSAIVLAGVTLAHFRHHH